MKELPSPLQSPSKFKTFHFFPQVLFCKRRNHFFATVTPFNLDHPSTLLVLYQKIPAKHMMTGRLEMKGQQEGLTLLFEEAVITAFFSDEAREKGGSLPRGKMG